MNYMNFVMDDVGAPPPPHFPKALREIADLIEQGQVGPIVFYAMGTQGLHCYGHRANELPVVPMICYEHAGLWTRLRVAWRMLLGDERILVPSRVV